MPKNECNIFFFFAGILGVLKVFTKHIIFILAILHHPEMKVSFLLNMNIPSDFGRVWKQTISWRFKKQSEHTKNIHSIHATESHRVDSRQFLAHSFWFAIHLSGFFFLKIDLRSNCLFVLKVFCLFWLRKGSNQQDEIWLIGPDCLTKTTSGHVAMTEVRFSDSRSVAMIGRSTSWFTIFLNDDLECGNINIWGV